jgi:hypothetical protein
MPNQNTSKRQPIVPIGPSIAYIPLTQGQYTRVNRERAMFLCQWNWHALWDKTTGTFYAHRSVDGGRKRISMQAQILGLSGHLIIGDHIDRDTLNNQDYNLRTADQTQQTFNQRLRRTNKSGCTGVYWSRQRNKWKSYIEVKGKRINLPDSTSREAAILIRRAAEIKYATAYTFQHDNCPRQVEAPR